MSGHSKWATIKHKKAATDAKRGKVFSEVSKMITVAVRDGGSGDVGQNPRLRVALEKARGVNMPNANIKKAIDKGLGKGGGGSAVEIVYEGFGPGGVGVLIMVLTDNRNRTGAVIKSTLERWGGSLGSPGSVGYMFERDRGEYRVKVPLPVEGEMKRKMEALVAKLDEIEEVEKVVTNMS